MSRSSLPNRSVFAAVDIGASSGRVVAGVVTEGRVDLEVVHRFPNGAVSSDGHLRWNLTGLFDEVLTGLTLLAERHPHVVSIGIDTWAVDYGLLDADGALIEEPIAYRDDRTGDAIARVHERIDRERLYAITGLQYLPFNTLYQLTAERSGPRWGRARHALLLPDLLAYWLTGEQRTEVTNASTTGLLDARTRSWSAEIIEALELPSDLFPPLIQPGATIGRLSPGVTARTGLPATVSVVAVGSHDTASAVVGVPATSRDFGYISSGTWSLVGIELEQPVLSDEGRAANFTNEGGVDGRVRYLRNVGGLWLLSESLRSWAEAGDDVERAEVLTAAAALPYGGPTVDVDDEGFIAPGDMPDRIRAACRRSGQAIPDSAAEVVRCVIDSLALAYARTLDAAERLSGQMASTVHLVGGGSQNELLCQLTADLSRRPVLAGPTEATALGNLAVQARAAAQFPADLDALRRAIAEQVEPRRYLPRVR